MKKIMTLMLGLSLFLGSAAFAEDKKADAKHAADEKKAAKKKAAKEKKDKAADAKVATPAK